MFEFFKRFPLRRRSRNLPTPMTRGGESSRDVVLRLQLPAPADDLATAVEATPNSILSTTKSIAGFGWDAGTTQDRPSPGLLPANRPSRLQSSHRERIFAMRIEHLQICNEKRCRLLAKVGVVTAGDLACCNPEQISRQYKSPGRAFRSIKRLRAAVRLAVAVDGMMPRDALILVAIHRRSVASLARESAAVLHRDLERFSLSSRGQRLVGHRGVPSLRRVKSWVGQCEQLVAHWIQSHPAETQIAA